MIGEKTRLRAVERSDIPLFVRWFNDAEILRYLAMYLPMSRAAEERWFETQLRNGSGHVFVIETLEDGVPIGNLDLHAIDRVRASAGCGVSICEKSYWNQGYGTDSLRTLVRFAFEELNLQRLYLQVFDFNERATRCYEKIGFQHEGRLREVRFVEGRYVDVLSMGLLREEWQAEEEERQGVGAAGGGHDPW